LDSISSQLKEKAKVIDDTYDSIDDTRMLLQKLEVVKKDIEDFPESLKTAKENVETLEGYKRTAKKDSEELSKHENDSKKIVEKCEAVLQLSTSHGLASAFEAQKQSLQKSMNWWVVGLLFALVAGGFIGHLRFETFTTLMYNKEIQPLFLTFNFVLSALSLGAPLWIVWLATSQITQKFRLSEDYAFKAAISKAFEGYMIKAEKLDAQSKDTHFAAQLFKSALTRLDEPPLNQIEKKIYATPWSQLLYAFLSKSESEKLTDSEKVISQKDGNVL
jgi:hypothetical protein